MASFDYKKEYKDLYLPGTKPALVDVPEMTFITVDGKGDPNEPDGEYKRAMELLYGLSYAIKMSKMSGEQPEGYFEYVVPPLEGLWWMEGDAAPVFLDKSRFLWTAMIRQPDFVTPAVLERAKTALLRKKPQLDAEPARLLTFTEGRCAQVMHLGPYDDEPATIERLEYFMMVNGLQNAIGDTRDGCLRRHHEIYLGDPRKCAPEKLKTVLRLPVRDNR